MKKLRIDLLSLLVLALLITCAIVIWGESLGIKTPDARSLWLSLVAFGTLILAVLASLDRFARAWDAVRALTMSLRRREPELADTTQASLLKSRLTQRAPKDLDDLRSELRQRYGLRWRYRLPWLLLIGDDAAIAQRLPDLDEQGWLITPHAVLVRSKLETARLKQLSKLRRRRPIDLVVLVLDGATTPLKERYGTHAFSIALARVAESLRWSAPIHALEIVHASSISPADMPVIACEVSRQANSSGIEAALHALRDQLSEQSLERLPQNGREIYLGQLSQWLDGRAKALANWLGGLEGGTRRKLPVRGFAFAPAFDDREYLDAIAELPLWQHLGDTARRQPGRRIGFHPVTVLTVLALSAISLWIGGMFLSGLQNARDLQAAQQAAHEIQSTPSTAARLQALDTLQQQIQRYEDRVQHHAPLFTRFGLNRDADVLAALWKPYAKASRDILVAPAAQDLEAKLVDLSQLQTSGLNEETSKWALQGHDTLKAYLMLAHPERVDAAFLAQQLGQHWTTDARIPPGQKQDLAERFARFYAEHLKANPDWRIEPRPELVTGARQTLLAVIGERNAQDTIYQGILRGAGNKYPDQTLASLTAGTDPRGLLRAVALVPGVFTRQAYEGYVAAAIEEAAKRKQVASDWVLTGGKPPQPDADADSGKDLQAALTEQYFDEYADHWQQFMNSAQWEPAATLPAVIDQLKLLADARQSPVIALMKSLEYQGGAGARKDSLSDTLVNKARDLIGKKIEVPEVAKADPAGPLGIAFGPVLRLVGQGGQGLQGNQGDLSLQRYLDRATALRLRLQQISTSSDGDAQARQMAQALFQGKGSELADTQAYAQLMAASFGNQWAGMGDALFVRPIAQATQVVLLPAQASLDDAWRQNIAMAWGRSFAGRYPFADTANDASLPELARFLRPQSGLIHAFLATNLAGVLELQGDQWVPSATAGQAMAFDPAFLKGINTLQHIAAHLLAQGEPAYRFQLKPIPTPGLTDSLLTVDNQKLHYYNQRETWQFMTWPASNLQEPGTRLQWQTEKAGTNKTYEFSGPWGWVRMLERARVMPIDTATFQLTWQASADTGDQKAGAGTGEPGAAVQPDAAALIARDAKGPASADLAYPISYQLRTDVSQGPLEMLWLRGFVLPSRIFAGKEPAGRMAPSTRK
ncbi:type VI secretion protein VasK [Cupriavidus pinatubonensis]|uniref:ImcF-related family protein n=1 Tax=Cupriavidus pinatubonensis TaxID=248026 RepID=UPI001C73865C|nr:ImcF-related family protein [Cupriavidus pinatubonensis]QYY29874.1 type VI secretion protein VasK [Cupriavidus pinatubonensis]